MVQVTGVIHNGDMALNPKPFDVAYRDSDGTKRTPSPVSLKTQTEAGDRKFRV